MHNVSLFYVIILIIIRSPPIQSHCWVEASLFNLQSLLLSVCDHHFLATWFSIYFDQLSFYCLRLLSLHLVVFILKQRLSIHSEFHFNNHLVAKSSTSVLVLFSIIYSYHVFYPNIDHQFLFASPISFPLSFLFSVHV